MDTRTGLRAATEHALRELVFAIKEPVVVLNTAGGILHCNTAAAAFAGLRLGGHATLKREDSGSFLTTSRARWSCVVHSSNVLWDDEVAEVVVLEVTTERAEDVRVLSGVVDALPLGIRVLERRDDTWIDLWQNEAARRAWALPICPAWRQLELAASKAVESGMAPFLSHLCGGDAERPIARYACRVARLSDEIVAVFTDDIASSPRVVHGTTERMAAIGRLAGGLAHDLNNLLTVIVSFTSLVRSGLPDSEPAAEDLDEVLRASDRATRLTSQLLAVSKRQPSEPAETCPSVLLASLHQQRADLLGNDIKLELDLESEWSVFIDPNQLEQACLHVMQNARDAMRDGRGEIRIQTADVTSEHGDFVQITFLDDGPGISESALPHIFEPFFTTKYSPETRGYGLGLAICYGIIHQAGGTIAASSPYEDGATFEIRLPRFRGNPRLASPTIDLGIDFEGSETVLVIDDEPMVREVVGRFLEGRGYRVILCEDGSEAVQLLSRTPISIDLVLSDVMMPTQSGPEVVSAIRSITPDVRVLYMSGYIDEFEELMSDEEHADCVEKPFSEEDLLRSVRRALG